MVGWFPRFLLRLVVRTQTPRSAASFGDEVDLMLVGEVTDSSPPG